MSVSEYYYSEILKLNSLMENDIETLYVYMTPTMMLSDLIKLNKLRLDTIKKWSHHLNHHADDCEKRKWSSIFKSQLNIVLSSEENLKLTKHEMYKTVSKY